MLIRVYQTTPRSTRQEWYKRGVERNHKVDSLVKSPIKLCKKCTAVYRILSATCHEWKLATSNGQVHWNNASTGIDEGARNKMLFFLKKREILGLPSWAGYRPR